MIKLLRNVKAVFRHLFPSARTVVGCGRVVITVAAAVLYKLFNLTTTYDRLADTGIILFFLYTSSLKYFDSVY